MRYVSERSRHSSSSTPPGVHSVHSVHQGLPNSMTMSLPPSLTLPNPVTISRSCDSLAQVQYRLQLTQNFENIERIFKCRLEFIFNSDRFFAARGIPVFGKIYEKIHKTCGNRFKELHILFQWQKLHGMYMVMVTNNLSH